MQLKMLSIFFDHWYHKTESITVFSDINYVLEDIYMYVPVGSPETNYSVIWILTETFS